MHLLEKPVAVEPLAEKMMPLFHFFLEIDCVFREKSNPVLYEIFLFLQDPACGFPYYIYNPSGALRSP